MRRFLGLTPPPDYSARVEVFRQSIRHRITAPHVTVKAPNGLTPDLVWLPAVREACASTQPFTVRVEGVRSFGRRVIYLAVHGEGVRDLHVSLLDAVAPAQRSQHEGRGAFTPHVTVVLAWEELGVTFDEALERARAELTEGVTFTARAVDVYRKPRPGAAYEVELSLPLST